MRYTPVFAVLALVCTAVSAAVPTAVAESVFSAEARAELNARYVGKTAWLRYSVDGLGNWVDGPVDPPPIEDESISIYSGDRCGPWTKVTVSEIEFGDGTSTNFDVLSGVKHQRVRLNMPEYRAQDTKAADFRGRVIEDFRYAASRIVSFRDPEILLREYNERFGSRYGARVLGHGAIEGMSKDALLESWGRPRLMERTILRTGTRETWTYGDGPHARVVTLVDDTIETLSPSRARR